MIALKKNLSYNQFETLLFPFQSILNFDAFSFSVRETSQSIKIFWLDSNQKDNAPENLVHSRKLPLEGSAYKKAINSFSPYNNYIEIEDLVENEIFFKLNYKMAIHFPVQNHQDFEGCLNFLYLIDHKDLNITHLQEKISLQIPHFLYQYKNFQFEFFTSLVSNLFFKKFFALPEAHAEIVSLMQNYKSLDKFQLFIEKSKKMLLIEEKKTTEVSFISHEFKKNLKINSINKVLDIIPDYNKNQFKLYQNSFFHNLYIPIEIKGKDKSFNCFMCIWRSESLFLDNYQIYEFILEKEFLFQSKNEFYQNIESEKIHQAPAELKVSEAQIQSLYNDLNEIQNLKNDKVKDMDIFIEKIKQNFESIIKNLPFPRENRRLLDQEKTNENLDKKLRHGNQENVLIIDQDQKTRFLIGQFLHQTNYKIFLAPSLSEAYEIMEKKKIDLVIIDISIEHFKGFFFLDEIVSNSDQSPSFIVLTNMKNTKILKKSYQLGAIIFLQKDKFSLKKLSQSAFYAIKYQRQTVSLPRQVSIQSRKIPSKQASRFFHSKKEKVWENYLYPKEKDLDNLSTIGINIQNPIDWIKKETLLQHSFYFLDDNIATLVLKGISHQDEYQVIFEDIEKLFIQKSKDIHSFIIDIQQCVFYGLGLDFFTRFIVRDIDENFYIKKIIFISSNTEVIEYLSYIPKIQERILFYPSIIDYLNHLT